MTTKDVNLFEKIRTQIQELRNELSVLSKSKPDNPVNSFKLKFINEKLEEANTILVSDFKPFKDFSVFDESALPSNSDAVMILSQYLDCLEAWRCANIRHDSYYWYWNVKDGQEIRTDKPTRFRKIST